MTLRHIVSFSGGKDSVATLLHMKFELGLGVEVLFCDTGHESPVTINYVKYVAARLGAMPQQDLPEIPEDAHTFRLGGLWYLRAQRHQCDRKLRGPDRPDLDKVMDMEYLVTRKKRFPSAKSRFCTTELKLKPMRRWLTQQKILNPDDTFVTVSGVRAEESAARAKYAEREPDLYMQEDYYDHCKRNGIQFHPFIEAWRPILKWKIPDVWACHKRHHWPPNPLYKQGMGRVGCFPCIHARKGELGAIAVKYPEAFDSLLALEKRVSAARERGLATFFPHNTTSKRYRRAVDPKSGFPVSTAHDVRDWAVGTIDDAHRQTEPMDENDGDFFTCSSIYGLCE